VRFLRWREPGVPAKFGCVVVLVWVRIRCVRIPNSLTAAGPCLRLTLIINQSNVPKNSVSFADSPDFVVSLARGLDIIKAFGTSERNSERPSSMRPPDALTLSEVAERTGLARAVVRRFLYTLVELGYVITDGKYFRLTAKILDLGYAYLSSFSLPKIAERFLEEVTLETKESSSASVLDEDEIVYVARVQTRRIMSVSLSIGSRLPAFCTSMGRVLLAHLPAEMLEKYLKVTKFQRFTEKTISDPEALRKELSSVFKQGYALVDQELEIGLRSLAVPVFAGGGRAVAAINIGTQAARISKSEVLQQFLPVLRKAAKNISSCLGHL
jgi:IclR family transcriptional regulator, pca regulon regulatory protein